MGVTRRDFFFGAGTLVLAAHLSPASRALAAGEPAPGPFDPDLFLRIAPDSTVTVIVKHFEMGQGVVTGLSTLVAEELDADWSQMRFEFAPSNARLYNNLMLGPIQATGQTTSLANSWLQMRQVGAAARAMLVAAAAQRWIVPAGEITVQRGIVRHETSGRQTMFGALANDAGRLPVPPEPKLKAPHEWRLIGGRPPRLDTADKTTGRATYGLDVRRERMLTAMIRRPDRFGAVLQSFDATDAKRVPGVVDVIQIPSGIAVLARDTWSAMRGRDALKVTWDESKAEMRSSSAMLADYRRMMTAPGLAAARHGDAIASRARAATLIESEFAFPYLAHAPMETLNAVIAANGERADFWAGSQAQTIDQNAVARVLGLRPEQVHVHTQMGGGSFGRRALMQADWSTEAASVLKASRRPGPIHVVWTREDDIKGGYYRPLVLHRLRVGIGADGSIASWEHKLAGKGIFLGTPLARTYAPNGIDRSLVEGLADMPYPVNDFSLDVYYPETPVPVLWWRSVGHSHNAHVVETTIDEIAHLTGQDPLAFRLGLLRDQPRDAAVLRLAAEKAGWGNPIENGRGRGIAVHHSFGTHVAMVAEVTARNDDIKVERIVAAVDCGVAVNPDIVAAQIESAVSFGLSAALRDAITLTNGLVDQGNFDDYEPTRMSEMPVVEVHIVKSNERPSGIGEPGLPPVAPAIGNAMFSATGQRRRSLPLFPQA